jgi:hypothetical protein
VHPGFILLERLAEFRRRSGERSKSFLPATCASAKTPLGLQSCARSEWDAADRSLLKQVDFHLFETISRWG